MTARFHIKENDILDRSRNDNRLNPVELCNTLNALDCIADKNVDEYSYIKRLECENKQLKQRNDRQAKRLAELYELMAKKDWESLTEIIDDFCSFEEQLQREWRTYE